MTVLYVAAVLLTGDQEGEPVSKGRDLLVEATEGVKDGCLPGSGRKDLTEPVAGGGELAGPVQ